MRTNLPVTDREFEIGDHVTLMSTTDLSSRLTYCNEAFLEVSGFDRDELMGEPHNIVRHPDMPEQAFADMWSTLKAGESWTALVKNRRKDGDYYWVRANVTPIRRNGQVTGYMSVRTKPSRDEIASAHACYRAFRENTAVGIRFHKGLIVRTGPRAWCSALQRMPVRWRIHAATALCAIGPTAAAAIAGLAGAPLAAMAGVTGALALLADLWLRSQITRPLSTVVQQALAVAAGQPAANITLNRVDEIGLILRAVNQAGLNLRSLVDDVSQQVAGLQVAGAEIAQGNSDLSSRAEHSASSLEQTAASMEQIAATVAQNAQGARHATQLASNADGAASKGGLLVSHVATTMQEISAASTNMAEIVGVIDGIAFQTNLLALNAAVEAARAGDQGRGFAVVAAEVRTLARRSAEAAKSIKSLIQENVEKVVNGARLANEAGQSMQDIVDEVRRVSSLIAEISNATGEQSSGIAQVNIAVANLDQLTQQNATLVQQSSIAAQGMKTQADRLSEAVGVFRTI